MLYVFKSILILASYFIVVYSAYRLSGKKLLPACMAAIWMILISGGNLYFDIRPYLFTYIFLALTIYILYEVYCFNNYKLLYFLAPITLFWVNTHGAYILIYIFQVAFLMAAFLLTKFKNKAYAFMALAGLSLVGIILILRKTPVYIFSGILFIAAGIVILIQILNPRGNNGEEYKFSFFRHSLICLGISIVAGFINPYGAEIFTYPFTFLRDSYYKRQLIEWIPPNLLGTNLPFFISVIVLVVLSVIFCKKLKIFDFIILGVFSYLALTVVRHGVLFSFAIIPMATLLINSLLEYMEQFVPKPQGLLKKSSPYIVLVLMLVVLTVSAFVFVIPGKHRVQYESLNMERELFPVASVEFLKENKIPGNMFNPYEWGGYFAWKLYPQYRIFIDGRANTLYSEELYRESLLTMAGYPHWEEAKKQNIPGWRQLKGYNFKGWEDVLDKHKINFVFINKYFWKSSGQMLPDRLLKSPNWIPVFEDRNEILFIRNSEENQSILSSAKQGKLNMPETPFSLNRQAEDLIRSNHLKSAKSTLERALKIDPSDVDSLVLMGTLELMNNNETVAENLFLKAVAINRHIPGAYYYLGKINQKKGNINKAALYYKKALKISPNFKPAKESLREIEKGKG